MAPTSSCRTSVGVAVLDGYLYAVGGQDGVSCLNFVERYVALMLTISVPCTMFIFSFGLFELEPAPVQHTKIVICCKILGK